MREDLIRPLRDGIAQLHEQLELAAGGGPSAAAGKPPRNKNNNDLFVYTNVALSPPTFYKQTGELLVYAQLNVNQSI
jgi:hypothetical protein